MLEGIHFSYDGIKSVDMGLVNVKIGGGMFEEAFLPTREINEIKISGRNKPYFQEVRLEPLEFKLSFAFEHGYDSNKIRDVAKWLNQNYYKPFYTLDNPNRIFYCMVEGDSSLIHNGLKQGYITLTMRCDSPYSYSPQYFKNGLKYFNDKKVVSIYDDIFSKDKGSEQINIKINEDGNMEVDRANVVWSMLSDMKWSDL